MDETKWQQAAKSESGSSGGTPGSVQAPPLLPKITVCKARHLRSMSNISSAALCTGWFAGAKEACALTQGYLPTHTKRGLPG